MEVEVWTQEVEELYAFYRRDGYEPALDREDFEDSGGVVPEVEVAVQPPPRDIFGSGPIEESSSSEEVEEEEVQPLKRRKAVGGEMEGGTGGGASVEGLRKDLGGGL